MKRRKFIAKGPPEERYNINCHWILRPLTVLAFVAAILAIIILTY